MPKIKNTKDNSYLAPMAEKNPRLCLDCNEQRE